MDAVLDAVIERLPDPKTFLDANPKKYRESGEVRLGTQARALIFDSVYDAYK